MATRTEAAVNLRWRLQFLNDDSWADGQEVYRLDNRSN